MTLTLQRFLESLTAAEPPLSDPLIRSVWYGLRGDWHQAHDIAQEHSTADAAWIHAWLHRIEGDLVNAGYWYRQAGRSKPAGNTQSEGEAIAAALLLT